MWPRYTLRMCSPLSVIVLSQQKMHKSLVWLPVYITCMLYGSQYLLLVRVTSIHIVSLPIRILCAFCLSVSLIWYIDITVRWRRWCHSRIMTRRNVHLHIWAVGVLAIIVFQCILKLNANSIVYDECELETRRRSFGGFETLLLLLLCLFIRVEMETFVDQ